MPLKWVVNQRQRCDLEMLLSGGFAPLAGFLAREDYESVLTKMRLANGQLWPLPVMLDVSDDFAAKIKIKDEIELLDADNTLLAHMTVTDKWKPDKPREAKHALGTEDMTHPAVDYLFNRTAAWYIGGPVRLVKLPVHFDYVELRHTPKTLKEFFVKSGWKKIVGFQTRNPLHRAHMELTMRAAEKIGGNVLIHPVVGMTKPGDVDHFTRVRCYQKLMPYYPKNKAALSLLPLAMRMAGPKCALTHAIIRKNYGCTHFIIGRNHADPGLDSKGKPFYGPYDAQELVTRYQDEIGICLVPFEEIVYVKERKKYCFASEVKHGETQLNLSGTELRNALLMDKPIPGWFSFPEVLEVLRSSFLPLHRQGVTLFFTGLSGAGKTTLAHALMAQLLMLGKNNITLLDGDVVRRILANELGFSRSDRDLNIRRIGFVASEVTRAGGIALCAAIAPYAGAREENRHLISQHGGYIEIHISTPLSTCEKRDTKGLYRKARAGELKGFTGIDDPYEPPVRPEITIDTTQLSITECISKIMKYLRESGYIKSTA